MRPKTHREASLRTSWRQGLDEQERKATAFTETYVRDYNHGTVGRNDLMLIVRLAERAE